MKRFLHTAKHIAAAVLALAVVAVLSVVTIYSVKGYKMYSDASAQLPLAARVDNIRSKEGFTPYDDLPRFYVDAVICVEDKRFEQHFGIDPLAIIRAAYIDISTHSFAEGGSTITQQLAKNLFFDGEKRVERKFAEIFAAFAIEGEYSKQEIFELYVNCICFGSGYYCVGDAARGYFGKEPAELDEYECAMLAGLPNAPSVYSPDNDIELAQRRTAVVLRHMVACGKLTDAEAKDILAQAGVELQAA